MFFTDIANFLNLKGASKSSLGISEVPNNRPNNHPNNHHPNFLNLKGASKSSLGISDDGLPSNIVSPSRVSSREHSINFIDHAEQRTLNSGLFGEKLNLYWRIQCK